MLLFAKLVQASITFPCKFTQELSQTNKFTYKAENAKETQVR